VENVKTLLSSFSEYYGRSIAAPLPETDSYAEARVLLLAHGTPDCVEEIPAYLANVTSGRPLPASVITESSTLLAHRGLRSRNHDAEARIRSRSGLATYVGMRNWSLNIRDTVAQMPPTASRTPPPSAWRRITRAPAVGLYRSACWRNRRQWRERRSPPRPDRACDRQGLV